MGFPWEFEENFESGGKGGFQNLVDPQGLIDFPGPHDELDVFPHRGGYCMRVRVGDRAEAYVEETVAHATAAGQTKWGRHQLYLSRDFDIALDSQLHFCTLVTSSGEQYRMFLTKRQPEGLLLGIAARFSMPVVSATYIPIRRGRWLNLEPSWQVDSGAGNDGRMWLYHGDSTLYWRTIDSGPVTAGRYGITYQDGAGRGFLLFDGIMVDDERLYPVEGAADAGELDNTSQLLTKSGFAFVGSGEVLRVTVIDNGSGDAGVSLYDVDTNLFAEHSMVAALRVDGANRTASMDQMLNIYQGCYVKLSGTNPRAIIQVGDVDELDDDDMDDDDDEE